MPVRRVVSVTRPCAAACPGQKGLWPRRRECAAQAPWLMEMASATGAPARSTSRQPNPAPSPPRGAGGRQGGRRVPTEERCHLRLLLVPLPLPPPPTGPLRLAPPQRTLDRPGRARDGSVNRGTARRQRRERARSPPPPPLSPRTQLCRAARGAGAMARGGVAWWAREAVTRPRSAEAWSA